MFLTGYLPLLGNFGITLGTGMMNLNRIIRKYGIEIVLNLIIVVLIFLLLYILL